jgi:hypothetical protein
VTLQRCNLANEHELSAPEKMLAKQMLDKMAPET